ncbi:class E sortase [Streptomyces sp. NBC_00335]|uniref:class E sortase n=1 Tax=unclassified Streptomyces TaxID=2593676 RepID=UPI002256B8C4|nr:MULTISPECIES: class E sortase [unclassified Streptomyces]MCX5406996.1 class E sortase [Streptomyces sp. NBC_00086]
MRDRVRVVVQGRGRRSGRAGIAGALWAAGELAVTVGVVVMLLVVHQVWWTNRQALSAAHEVVRELEEGGWPGSPVEGEPEGGQERPYVEDSVGPSDGPDGDGSSGDASAGNSGPRTAKPPRESAYGILRIPRLGVAVPVAQGVDKRSVLDKGYAGHYTGTAQPGAEGNFAVAGHRNTHGEPFRYINRLRPGDELIVDVRGKRYVYLVGQTLAQTTERDTGVIAPVPRSAVTPGAGYSEPGAYITLTTCTPEYSSKYRLVVWGTLKR